MEKIVLPQEIDVWYLIPAIRKEFAVTMKKQGVSQKDIAKILGLTEAAVSQYINQKRGRVSFPAKIKSEIVASSRKIIKKGSVSKEISRILDLSKQERFRCHVHRKYSWVKNNCRDCF